MTKTKEQLEEEKKISLSIRIKPLDLDGMSSDDLVSKANELWDTIVRLETEKYDLEERQKRQDYDVSYLKILEPVCTSGPAASRNDVLIKSGQNWLKNNHLALLISIRDTLCIKNYHVYQRSGAKPFH